MHIISFSDALSHAKWKAAMVDEMEALGKKWNIIYLLVRELPSTNGLLFLLSKYKPNRSIQRYKTSLVVKGFTQAYGIDHLESFSPMEKLSFARIILSMQLIFHGIQMHFFMVIYWRKHI